MASTQTRKKAPPPTPPKATGTAGLPNEKPMHPAAYALGIVAIVIGLLASGVLALDHFEIMKAPGCGAGSGCEGAANSAYGHVTVPVLDVKWPTSHMGLAYFVAVGAVWLISRRGMSLGLRLMIVAGAIGSAFYMTQMVLHHKEFGGLCKYCIACHVANLALLALAFMGSGRAGGTGRAIATGAMAFAVSTAALIGLGAWSDEAARRKGENELQDSINELITKTDADTSTAIAPTPPAQPENPAPRGNDEPTRTVTVAPPIVDGELIRGAPELRDRPPAIEVQGYTSGLGMSGTYRIGYEDAPIRIVMFSDYQCSDCQRVEKELFKLLEARNDIFFTARHFPFCRPCNLRIDQDMHPNACWAAIAAEVAGQMDGPRGFWRMHQWLFDRRGSFTNQEIDAVLKSWGYNVQAFTDLMNKEMNGGPLLKKIQDDVETASSLGLHFTPLTYVNGVEIRAFRTSGALTRAVLALADRNPPFGSPASDHPASAFEKYVTDWEMGAQGGAFGRDRFLAVRGPEDAKVRIDAWIDYSSADAKEMDAQIRKILSERQDTFVVYRLFPLDASCVPQLAKNNIAGRSGSCALAKAAEAAGQVAGKDAYFAVHDWLFEHQAEFLDATQQVNFPLDKFKAFLTAQKLDADAIVKAMDSPDVAAAITDDVAVFYSRDMKNLPHAWVNFRDVPRWNLVGHDVLRAIVERAADAQ